MEWYEHLKSMCLYKGKKKNIWLANCNRQLNQLYFAVKRSHQWVHLSITISWQLCLVPRPSKILIAYCKRTRSGRWEGLGMRLVNCMWLHVKNKLYGCRSKVFTCNRLYFTPLLKLMLNYSKITVYFGFLRISRVGLHSQNLNCVRYLAQCAPTACLPEQ